MVKKYIVRNCPCIYKSYRTNYDCDYDGPCEDCTNCLIKQLIEKCREYEDAYFDNDWSNGLADEILQLFEIEEVNNDK